MAEIKAVSSTLLERARELFTYDAKTGRLLNLTARGNKAPGSVAGSASFKGYREVTIDYAHYREHRLIWLMHYGAWPTMGIDHINGDPSDNRIENLRLATARQNNANRGRGVHNTSGLKGVSFYKPRGKWRAFIRIAGKNRQLGSFHTAEAAHDAYVRAAKREFGDFANGGHDGGPSEAQLAALKKEPEA